MLKNSISDELIIQTSASIANNNKDIPVPIFFKLFTSFQITIYL